MNTKIIKILLILLILFYLFGGKQMYEKFCIKRTKIYNEDNLYLNDMVLDNGYKVVSL